MGHGYALYLQRNSMGVCTADLWRGWWPFKTHVRIPLDRQEFDFAKRLLGHNPKRTVKLRRE
jgi:hypothetical protein